MTVVPGSLSIAGFDILAKLSSGGMGDVLLARRRGAHGFEKLLAIKTIRGDLTRRPDIRAMFLDEARLSARLDHPTIAQVYDFGEDGDTLYLAMEYVPGIAFNKLLIKLGGALPPVLAMRMVAEVCRGLHAAHELRDLDGTALDVVHRDVTPGNLMFAFDGHTKILDFGIAFMKNRESPDTVVGEVKGKPSYMAPEQLRGQAPDRRADVYSVSVVLHELLTGRKLFTRETVVATVLAVETHAVAPPSAIVGPLPAGLDDIVLKGLERHPEDRFPDARAMAVALERAVAQQPDAESLETFVETALAADREAHRAWIQDVLAAAERGAPGECGRAPRLVAPRPRSQPRGPQPIDLGVLRTAALAESTTLIPAQSESSESPASAPRSRGRIGTVLTWLMAGGLSLSGGLLGYHLAFRHDDLPRPLPPLTGAEVRPADDSENAAVAPSAGAAATPSAGDRKGWADLAAPAPGSAPSVASVRPGTEPLVEPEVAAPAPGSSPKRLRRARLARVREAPAPAEAPPTPDPAASQATVAAAAVRPVFGYVTIGAEPYALVRIDGQEVGATPIMRRKLPAGRHEVELVQPDNGEVRLRRSITLGENEHLRVTAP